MNFLKIDRLYFISRAFSRYLSERCNTHRRFGGTTRDLCQSLNPLELNLPIKRETSGVHRFLLKDEHVFRVLETISNMPWYVSCRRRVLHKTDVTRFLPFTFSFSPAQRILNRESHVHFPLYHFSNGITNNVLGEQVVFFFNNSTISMSLAILKIMEEKMLTILLIIRNRRNNCRVNYATYRRIDI